MLLLQSLFNYSTPCTTGWLIGSQGLQRPVHVRVTDASAGLTVLGPLRRWRGVRRYFHCTLPMHETQCDVDDWTVVTSVLMHNPIAEITLSMFPAIFHAIRAGPRLRLLYMATRGCVQFCLGSGIVSKLDSICNIEDEMTATSPKAYFKAWIGRWRWVLVPVRDIAVRPGTELQTWGRCVHFRRPNERSTFQWARFDSLNREVWPMPQCANDGK